MKLRNKKTGEIVDIAVLDDLDFTSDNFAIWLSTTKYNSLAELNAEWEDYKEKEYFYLNMDGDIRHTTNQAMVMYSKQIGNYFETEEEAEEAVEKLKAWKRLKDKGFRFDVLPALGHCDDKKFDISIIGTMPAKWWYNDKVVDDIHYIFGGEE